MAKILPAEGARLAVMASPEMEQVSTLLTSALSQDSRLEVLERNEIDKILVELGFQSRGMTAKDSVRVGHVLKADALVFVEKTDHVLTLRLVAVDSGAILAFFTSPFPIAEMEMWSKLRAEDVARVVAKLAPAEKGAVPVSFLRINSALGGRNGTVLEDSLNRLLAVRLTANPKLILLERSRLQEAVAEKGFAAESKAFLNSSWVVEGTITELDSHFFLTLRLQPPGGNKADHTIKAEAADLVTLVENANAAILKILAQPVQPWNPTKESARFAEEAQWAAGNGMWEQAAEAIEAAIALGNDSSEALRWRWRCYDRLSRNVPGPKPASGFNAGKGKGRPTVPQILHMTRSVRLCREALVSSPKPLQTGVRFQKFPQTLDARDLFGNGPAAEGSALLRAAGRLIAAGEKNRPVNGEEAEALADLRDQMHLLYDEIVEMTPELALIPRAANQVPPWSREGDPSLRTEPRNEAPVWNIHMERLENGRLWEGTPAPYFAFVKKCLSSDLPSDPYFFQLVLDRMGRKAELEAFMASKTYGPEWRAAGKMLGGERNASVEVGGAMVLCRTGLPLEGIAIFARNQEEVLNGRLSLDYLVEAFSTGPAVENVMQQVGGSMRDAKGAFKDFLVALLGRGFVPSPDLVRKLHAFRFSDRQAAELLAAFQNIKATHAANQLPENWLPAADSLIHRLSERAGSSVKQEAVPRSSAVQTPAATPHAGSSPSSGNLPPLKVDLAWVAQNYEKPDAPGLIRWALARGDKIWLQVEYFEGNPLPIRRIFVSLDLPSLKSHTVHRDVAPQTSRRGLRTDGPSFACDGEGIYFWNGTGLSYIRGGETRDLNVPELDDPYLWLIDGKLYIADRAGAILRLDPTTDRHEILASPRRRPPQSTLDTEPQLQDVRRISRAADGSIAVHLGNSKIYKYLERKQDWEMESKGSRDLSPDQLLASLEGAWDETGPFNGQQANLFLRTRARSEVADTGSHAERSRSFMYPVAKYLGELEATADGKKLTMVHIGSGVVFQNDLWCLLEEPGAGNLWMLKLRPSTDEFACRQLDFSPEFQAYTALAQRPSGIMPGQRRLIPTEAGAAIYSPNEPVLWFVPIADFLSSIK